MNSNSKIYVAGHKGLVGSAIVNNLYEKGYRNIIMRTHKELDLTIQDDVLNFFSHEKPEYVILAAAKVGGIVANNTYRADFIYENLQIQNNIIHSSYLTNIKKLLFLGSTCIYPKNAPQPMAENALLTSPLEYTNEPYAIAKIAGIKMCESYNIQYGTNYISAMPTNLYGENDNFDLEKSHVLPALIRKFHLAKLYKEENFDALLMDLNIKDIYNAKEYLNKFGISKDEVEIWGTGKPRREFLFSADLAEACVFLMENHDFNHIHDSNTGELKNTHINIGTGVDITIKDLAELIRSIVGFNGRIYFNKSKPDGTLVKVTDTSKINSLGWKPAVKLNEGIKYVYDAYKKAKDL